MITNIKNYSRFVKLLSIVGISVFSSTITYNTHNYITSNIDVYSSKDTKIYNTYDSNYKSVKSKDNAIDNTLTGEEKAIVIAKQNAPYDVDYIDVQYIEDEIGKLTTLDVYLKLPQDADQKLIFDVSRSVTGLFESEEYLITYL